MKGLILSGGAGTRLRPITHTAAKQLVPVANKPVLFYGLEAMRAAGITEVGIVVGDTRAEIEAAVGDGSAFGLAVTYLPQDAPLGLAHAVLISEAFLGDEPFVMYLGDNLLEGGHRAVRAGLRAPSQPDALILLQKVADPQSYGIAELDGDGRVVAARREAGRAAQRPRPGGRVPLHAGRSSRASRRSSPARAASSRSPTRSSTWSTAACTSSPHVVTGWWKDTGKLEDMLEANRLVLSTLVGDVQGELSTRRTLEGPRGHRPRQPARALHRARPRRHRRRLPRSATPSSVRTRPSATAWSSTTPSSSTRSSSRTAASRTCGTRMADSLIGRDCVIAHSEARPVAYRFLVGDSCQIGIL